MLSIEKEANEDITAIHQVNLAAFKQPNEAVLVDTLREAGALTYSLVAKEQGRVIGHLAVSPVTITDEDKEYHAVGLGPVAVSPSRQKTGIGKALINHLIDHVLLQSDNLLVVLGHPEYYPKFGFKPSLPFRIKCEYDVPAEAFMVLELKPGALTEISGVVRYHKAFSQV